MADSAREPTPDGVRAMARAVALAEQGPEWGANPRVGCVLMAHDGTTLGEGFHAGAGTAHAEVVALADAAAKGLDVRGATAYVTLEPCRHTGRTGPCVEALAAAGVGAVVYAVTDPGAESGGGAAKLRERGVEAVQVPDAAAAALVERFVVAVQQGWPFVVLKAATTLDGRVAALDGSSKWITGAAAREHAHAERARVGAIVVGTETIVRDDPSLDARPGGQAGSHQPLRVVMGHRQTPSARVWQDGNALQVATHDPAELLAALHAISIRTVIVEGGATVATAFLRAGLVNELHAYVAPAILGAGTSAVGDLGIGTIGNALRLSDPVWTTLGADVLLVGHPEWRDA